MENTPSNPPKSLLVAKQQPRWPFSTERAKKGTYGPKLQETYDQTVAAAKTHYDAALTLAEDLWDEMRAQSKEDEGQPVLMGSFGWHALEKGGHAQFPHLKHRIIGDVDSTYYTLPTNTPNSRYKTTETQNFELMQKAAEKQGMDFHFIPAGGEKGTRTTSKAEYFVNAKGKTDVKRATRTVSIRSHYPEAYASRFLNEEQTQASHIKLQSLPDNSHFLPPMKFNDDKGEFYHDHLLQALAVKMVRGLRTKNNHQPGLMKPLDLFDAAILKNATIRNDQGDFIPVYDAENSEHRKLLRLLIVLTATLEDSPGVPSYHRGMHKVTDQHNSQKILTRLNPDTKDNIALDIPNMLKEVRALYDHVFEHSPKDPEVANLGNYFSPNERQFYHAIRYPEANISPRNQKRYILEKVNKLLTPEYQELFDAYPELKQNISAHPLLLKVMDKGVVHYNRRQEEVDQRTHPPICVNKKETKWGEKDISLPGNTSWGDQHAPTQKPSKDTPKNSR